jgi:hypothetical protein
VLPSLREKGREGWKRKRIREGEKSLTLQIGGEHFLKK